LEVKLRSTALLASQQMLDYAPRKKSSSCSLFFIKTSIE
jgi:hypothetical protein